MVHFIRTTKGGCYMVLPTKAVFESTLLALPKIATATYTGFTGWIGNNTDSNLILTNILPATNNLFVFNQATMAAQMATLTPTASQSAASAAFFNALEQAILASVFTILPGSYVGASSPATTYSAVTSVIPDPPSLVAAKAAGVNYLNTTPLSLTEPVMANALRTYLLALTYTVTGLNSLPVPTALVTPTCPTG